MIALKTEFKFAEMAKKALIGNNLLAKDYALSKDEKNIYFPVMKKSALPFPHSYCQKAFEHLKRDRGLKEELLERKIISEKEAKDFVSSFDTCGDIAILEIPESLEKKEGKIAQTLLELNKHIRTVAKKASATEGAYRIRKLKIIGGKKRLSTLYRENGCSFKIDLQKTFFSSRLSFERQRVASLAKEGENVFALFAGAGFYPIVMAKEAIKKKRKTKTRFIAVELNPFAVRRMRENVLLNKMQDMIEVIEGDVNKIMLKKRFRRFADRVVMPLPHSAYDFLDAALFSAKKNCIIHFYFIPESEEKEGAVKKAQERIRAACERNNRKFKTVFSRVVKSYAPHVDQVVVDFKLVN